METVIKFKGKDIELRQNPYITATSLKPHEKPYYEAYGTDQDGNDVMVKWVVLDEFLDENNRFKELDCLDESGICDWDNPSTVYIL